MIIVSVLVDAGALTMLLTELRNGTTLETARTMAVNAIVVAEMFYLLNNRFLVAPGLGCPAIGSRWRASPPASR